MSVVSSVTASFQRAPLAALCARSLPVARGVSVAIEPRNRAGRGWIKSTLSPLLVGLSVCRVRAPVRACVCVCACVRARVVRAWRVRARA